jgi:hypothetical protein
MKCKYQLMVIWRKANDKASEHAAMNEYEIDPLPTFLQILCYKPNKHKVLAGHLTERINQMLNIWLKDVTHCRWYGEYA